MGWQPFASLVVAINQPRHGEIYSPTVPAVGSDAIKQTSRNASGIKMLAQLKSRPVDLHCM